ncbi:MAG: hypothetical protein REI09_00030 [Candidatus Dactylopiibacterium sp.]|nr:hypothetical protein [Candidatus Dactylopiibacterium sp.]
MTRIALYLGGLGAALAALYVWVAGISAELTPITQGRLRGAQVEAGERTPDGTPQDRQMKLPAITYLGQAGTLKEVTLTLDIDDFLSADDMSVPGERRPPAKGILVTQAINGMDVYLNGVWIGGYPRSTAQDRYVWYRPLRVSLPRRLLNADGPNVVTLEISTLNPKLVLASIYVGRIAEVVRAQRIISFVGTSSLDGIALFSLIVALFMLGGWLASPREKMLALAFWTALSLAALLWLVSCTYLPAAYYKHWQWGIYVLSTLVACLISSFVFSAIQEPPGRRWYALAGLTIAGTAVLYPALGDGAQEFMSRYWIPLAIVAVYHRACYRLVIYVARHKEAVPSILLVQCLMFLASGIYDYWTVSELVARPPQDSRWWLAHVLDEPVILTHLTVPLLLAAMSMALLKRFHANALSTQQANVTLRETLLARERELAVHYRKQQEAEHLSSVRMERDRIHRDLHDSIGSRLVTMLFAVRNGTPDTSSLERDLTTTIADIRRILAATPNRETRSLQDILFSYCSALEDTLASTGFSVEYTLESGEEVSLLGDAALHILLIVEETVANAVKCPRAGGVSIRLQLLDSSLILLIDCAFDKDAASGPAATEKGVSLGRGLENMRHRAEVLGADYEFRISEAGSSTTLFMPLVAGSPPRGVRTNAPDDLSPPGQAVRPFCLLAGPHGSTRRCAHCLLSWPCRAIHWLPRARMAPAGQTPPDDTP